MENEDLRQNQLNVNQDENKRNIFLKAKQNIMSIKLVFTTSTPINNNEILHAIVIYNGFLMRQNVQFFFLLWKTNY